MTEVGTWRRCSACKKPIALGAGFYACSVSTCNRKRTALAFCSVSCWEVHLPTANHREAWALEKQAPRSADESADETPARTGRRRLVRPEDTASGQARSGSDEVLIIASRLKEYVRSRSGFNTSDKVLEPLSEIVRRVCDEAIRNATREGRRTVLDRDLPES